MSAHSPTRSIEPRFFGVMTQRRTYQDEYPYFVTFNTREGLRLFEDVEYAELMGRIIVNAGRLKRFDILAYQIMPDHVHVLVFNTNFSIAAAESRARKIHSPPPPARASAPAIGLLGAIAPTEGCARGKNVSQLMHCIKSYFATEIRKRYGINYSVLQPRFYTRIINTYRYLHTIIEYIQHNPIKDNLPRKYCMMPYQFIDAKKINYIVQKSPPQRRQGIGTFP